MDLPLYNYQVSYPNSTNLTFLYSYNLCISNIEFLKKRKEINDSFADTHLGNTFPRSKFVEIVNRVNELKPDIVVLTGDLIDAKISEDLLPILEPIGWLNPKYGIYYVTGNHEYLAGSAAEWIIELSNHKVHFLHNTHTEISTSLPLFPSSPLPPNLLTINICM
jgi:predicted MPP superfamily phosphohydrolase